MIVKTEHIGAKFSPEGAERIRVAATSLGFASPYALVQMLCDCIVRLKDKPADMSEAEKKLIAAFDCLVAWNNATNITTNDEVFDVRTIPEAFYVVHKKGRDASGQTIMHYRRKMLNDNEVETVDYNTNDIISKVLKLACPARYKRLKRLMQLLKVDTITGMIDHLLNEYHSESLDDTISEMFSDNENSFTRRKSIADAERKYKRKLHRNIESKQFSLFGGEEKQDDKCTD